MPIQIVQLGTPRLPEEGLRLGTVRRPPRGVPKADFARLNYYDLWLPVLSPTPETIKLGQTATTTAAWQKFLRKYHQEMNQPTPQMLLQLLAAFSHRSHFSVGCYCEDENRCHRSELRKLLVEMGAEVIA